MAGKNQKYTQEFKQTIVDLYHSGKTYNQIKELQKRNARLEEENLILKKAIAIFTPHSNKD